MATTAITKNFVQKCIQKSPSFSSSSCLITRLISKKLFRRTTSDKSYLMLIPIANYKSKQSLEFLYPNSKIDFRTLPSFSNQNDSSKTDEEFSGIIPVDKIQMKYLKSSGPGGQNVNKVNTKVEIRFHVESADWIPHWTKAQILVNEKSRINKEGFLIISSDRTRKQLLNQADCLQKIRTIVFNASHRPREPTPEDEEFHAQRIAKIQRSVLKVKRENSLKKRSRQSPSIDSL